MLRTLPAVDRLVGDVIDALRETGRLENTMVVFTSDNGMLWGEHRWGARTSRTRRPSPSRSSSGTTPCSPAPGRHDLVTNLDFAPTFAELAGATTPDVEGLSFLPLLLGQTDLWRDGFLMEHMASHGGNGVPSYCGFHTKRYVLVRYNGGDGELYDLRVDPWQRENLYDSPAYAALQASLNERLVAACQPLPRGLVLGN